MLSGAVAPTALIVAARACFLCFLAQSRLPRWSWLLCDCFPCFPAPLRLPHWSRLLAFCLALFCLPRWLWLLHVCSPCFWRRLACHMVVAVPWMLPGAVVASHAAFWRYRACGTLGLVAAGPTATRPVTALACASAVCDGQWLGATGSGTIALMGLRTLHTHGLHTHVIGFCMDFTHTSLASLVFAEARVAHWSAVGAHWLTLCGYGRRSSGLCRGGVLPLAPLCPAARWGRREPRVLQHAGRLRCNCRMQLQRNRRALRADMPPRRHRSEESHTSDMCGTRRHGHGRTPVSSGSGIMMGCGVR